MDLQSIISKRRTTKPADFNGTIIPSVIFDEILNAANWAPNHGQTEPWRLFVFDKDGLENFSTFHAELYKSNTPSEEFLLKKYETIKNRTLLASHLIVLAVSVGSKSNIPLIEEICATACAAQNMLLTATANGVSSYWGTGGMTYEPIFKKAFGLKSADQIIGLLYFGYTNQPKIEGKRNSEIQQKTTFNLIL
jgi:nitroreductase